MLTDMIVNFEPQKLELMARWLTWFGGAQHPDDQTPRDMRLTLRARAAELRSAVDTMIGWDPAWIILDHPRLRQVVRPHGADELRRAFRWLANAEIG